MWNCFGRRDDIISGQFSIFAYLFFRIWSMFWHLNILCVHKMRVILYFVSASEYIVCTSCPNMLGRCLRVGCVLPTHGLGWKGYIESCSAYLFFVSYQQNYRHHVFIDWHCLDLFALVCRQNFARIGNRASNLAMRSFSGINRRYLPIIFNHWVLVRMDKIRMQKVNFSSAISFCNVPFPALRESPCQRRNNRLRRENPDGSWHAHANIWHIPRCPHEISSTYRRVCNCYYPTQCLLIWKIAVAKALSYDCISIAELFELSCSIHVMNLVTRSRTILSCQISYFPSTKKSPNDILTDSSAGTMSQHLAWTLCRNEGHENISLNNLFVDIV